MSTWTSSLPDDRYRGSRLHGQKVSRSLKLPRRDDILNPNLGVILPIFLFELFSCSIQRAWVQRLGDFFELVESIACYSELADKSKVMLPPQFWEKRWCPSKTDWMHWIGLGARKEVLPYMLPNFHWWILEVNAVKLEISWTDLLAS